MTPKRLWLIDGHNIIFAVPSLKALQVNDRRDEARQALADHLQRFAQARGEKVLVVFDGNELASNPEAGSGPLLEVVYTRPAEGGADNRIIYEATRRTRQRQPVTVVTDDINTLADKLPRDVDHLAVGEFWLKHIDKPPAPGSKRVEGDFSKVESEILEYSAAEQASAAREAQTTQGAAASGAAGRSGPPPSAPQSAEEARRDRLRLKRDKGRLRQQRRLERQRKPGRRR